MFSKLFTSVSSNSGSHVETSRQKVSMLKFVVADSKGHGRRKQEIHD